MRKIMREFGVNLAFKLKKFVFKFTNLACEFGLNLAFKFRNLACEFGLNSAFKFRNFAKIFALNSLKFSEKKFVLKSQNVVD